METLLILLMANFLLLLIVLIFFALSPKNKSRRHNRPYISPDSSEDIKKIKEQIL